MTSRIKSVVLSAMAVCTFLGAAAQNYTPSYRLINKPEYPTNDLAVATFTVTDYGADATGGQDCSDIFQTLLDKLAGVGTKSGERGNYENIAGGVLYVPAGTYLLKKQLFIPRGVTLRGDWKKPVKGQPVGGTILKIDHHQGTDDINQAAIIMQPTTEVSNIAFWYPNQNAASPAKYPPTVLFGQNYYWGNDYCNLRHVTFVNSYIGVMFNYTNGGGCPNIFECYGTPLSVGIEMDALADVGRFDWIDFSPAYWAGSGLPGSPNEQQVAQWTKANATGFVMRRNDWSYTCNYSCDRYAVGFMTAKARTENSTPNGHCYNFTMKDCGTGVKVTGTSYAGYMYTRVNTPGCQTGVEIDKGTDGPSLFYECQIEGSSNAILMPGDASAPLQLQDCHVKGTTSINGGQYVSDGTDYAGNVVIGAKARTIFTGNTFQSGRLMNNSVFECVVSDARNGGKKLPDFPEEYMEIKTARPTRAALYVVEGLTPLAIKDNLDNAPDCTNAIQQRLNQAASEGGGIVYLPAGHYRLNGTLTIPTGVELKGASDLGSVPKGHGTILETYYGENNENAQPFITMAEASGLRGITVNYPRQTSPNTVKAYPYTVRGNRNCYIVNLSLRAAYRGVDLFTNRCDNHYVDYLAGHAFMNVIRVGGGSMGGTISNIQCNTIAYACGNESKFGSWPNSDGSNNGACYTQNMRDLDFFIIGDCKGEILYNNFLYGCRRGMLFQKDGSHGAAQLYSLGNAVDGAVDTFVFNGSDDDLDLINSQVVALNGTDAAHFVTTGSGMDKTATFFSSCHWGGGNYFANLQGGHVDFLLINTNQTGTVNSMTVRNGATLKLHNGYVNNIRQLAANSGTDERVMSITSTIVNPNGGNTGLMPLWQNNLPAAWKLVDTSTFYDRNGWVATASNNNNNAYRSLDGNADTRWDTAGAQTAGQWYNVNFNTNLTFSSIVLDSSGSPGDGPAGYEVEVFTDGAWRQVASGQNGGAVLFIDFPEVTASQVRIRQTVTKSGGYWSIHEFNVVDPSKQEQPAVIPGSVYIIGAFGSVGVPAYTEGYDWDPSHAIAMTQESEGVFTFTFVVGETLNANHVNFKFFPQAGWGDEFLATANNYHLTLQSDVFEMGDGSREGFDNGNIFLRSGSTLKAGEHYTFTIDCSQGADNGVLTVTNTTPTGITSVSPTQRAASVFDLQGRRISGKPVHGLYIVGGRKVAVR